MHLRFTTAGESHGKALVAIVEGLPAGLPVIGGGGGPRARPPDAGLRPRRADEDRARPHRVARRRAGRRDARLAGRDADRQPRLGQLGGRHGARGATEPGELRRRRVSRPRPGHADLAGVLKYDRLDARDILERASARETAARVAAGALAKRLLDEFGVEIGSHVVSLGGVDRAAAGGAAGAAQRRRRSLRGAGARPRRSSRRSCAASTRRRRRATPWAARSRSWPAASWSGWAATSSWDRKLDGRLAGLLMSIPAVKGVEIGTGLRGGAAARLRGARSDLREPDAASAHPGRPPRRLPAAEQQRRRSRGRDHHRASRWWFASR